MGEQPYHAAGELETAKEKIPPAAMRGRYEYLGVEAEAFEAPFTDQVRGWLPLLAH